MFSGRTVYVIAPLQLSRPYADTPDRYLESPPQTSVFSALGSRPTIPPPPALLLRRFWCNHAHVRFCAPDAYPPKLCLVTTRLYLPEVHSPAVYYPST